MPRFFFATMMLTLCISKSFAGEVPKVVLQYFDAFTKSQTATPSLDSNLLQEYANCFFDGFVNPSGAIITKSDLDLDAYTNGQVYWRSHPSERERIFAAYGYLPVEREGVWFQGFETSAFQPADPDEGGWWLRSLEDASWQTLHPHELDSVSARIHLHIVGYLSPKGRYGHLNAFEREVFIKSAVQVDSKGD